MHTVIFTNEVGHIYSQCGLLDYSKTDQLDWPKKFHSKKRARWYAKSFIRRYPQASAEIYFEGTAVETIQDEAYWEWKEDNLRKWDEVTAKMHKVSGWMFYGILSLAGIALALILHVVGYFGFPLFMELVIAPLIIIAGWKIGNRMVSTAM